MGSWGGTKTCSLSESKDSWNLFIPPKIKSMKTIVPICGDFVVWSTTWVSSLIGISSFIVSTYESRSFFAFVSCFILYLHFMSLWGWPTMEYSISLALILGPFCGRRKNQQVGSMQDPYLLERQTLECCVFICVYLYFFHLRIISSGSPSLRSTSTQIQA